jgi:hypothetical protein
MATPLSVDSVVLDVFNLRSQCTQPLSEEIVRRINTIRDKCVAAEKQEVSMGASGPHGWRRGPAGGTTTQVRPGGGGGSGGNRWREHPPHHHQNSHRNGGHGGGGGGGGAPRTPGDHKNVPRYVSIFTNTEQTVEDKILNSVIHGKLQSLAAQNYDEVKQFLIQVLDGDEVDFLSDVMKLIFNKASLEEMFCPYYARLVAELSKLYPSWGAEFQKFYGQYLTIFEEISETECKDYEMFVQRNREKQKRTGYSQFLAELTRQGVITTDQLLRLYTVVLDQIKHHAAAGVQHEKLNDQYVECLRAMTKAFAVCDTPCLLEMRDTIRKGCESTMEDMLSRRKRDFPGMTQEASFGIMECLDIFRGSSF